MALTLLCIALLCWLSATAEVVLQKDSRGPSRWAGGFKKDHSYTELMCGRRRGSCAQQRRGGGACP